MCSKFVFVILFDDFGKNYFMDNNAQITEIGSCIMYLTNSDTDTRNWCCLSVGIG